jgi:hypothetical protein
MSRHHLRQGALAGTIRPHQGMHLALGQNQTHPFQNLTPLNTGMQTAYLYGTHVRKNYSLIKQNRNGYLRLVSKRKATNDETAISGRKTDKPC